MLLISIHIYPSCILDNINCCRYDNLFIQYMHIMETNKCILKYVVSHLSHTIVSLSDSLDLCLKFRSTLVSQPCSMYIYMYMYILSFLVQETHNYYKKQCVSRLRKTLSKSNTIFMNVKCLVCMILVNRTDFPKLFWQSHPLSNHYVFGDD